MHERTEVKTPRGREIWISGPRKSGKTKLLCDLANEAYALGKKVTFVTSEMAIQALRGTPYRLHQSIPVERVESEGFDEYVRIDK